MLFFGRKVGEGFVIGGNVKVTITEVSGKNVRVSIDAPYEIDVFRTEIQERIDAGMEKSKRPEAVLPSLEAVPIVPGVLRMGERLPGELMRRKPQ
jgi:carbon storage regulator